MRWFLLKSVTSEFGPGAQIQVTLHFRFQQLQCNEVFIVKGQSHKSDAFQILRWKYQV